MKAAGSFPTEYVEALKTELAVARAVAARVKAINADLEARNALLEFQKEKMRRAAIASSRSART